MNVSTPTPAPGEAHAIAVLVLIIALMTTGCGPQTPPIYDTISYTVLEKTYSPDTRNTQLAPTFGGKGVRFTVVTTGHSEAFILLVREGHNNAHTIEVTADDYANAEVGKIFNRNERR